MAKKVIGLMSGTSLDGIDAALVNISENKGKISVELEEFLSLDYDKELKAKILKGVNKEKSNLKIISELNIDLAHRFSKAANKLIYKTDLDNSDIDLIGSHGQTVFHNVSDKKNISTLQITSGSYIAEKTGITTVFNFRMRDLAVGGEGAPLVPYTDYLLYKDKKKNRILQNIGGISNYSYLPADCKLNEVRGSDNGPGNMIIDNAVNILTKNKLSFDKDGKMAKKGKISQKLLDKMMVHPFIKKKVPKSSGRVDFGQAYAKKIIAKGKEMELSDYDIIATITAFTALAIVDSYQRFVGEKIDEVIVGGGGSYNPQLMKVINYYLAKKYEKKIDLLTQEDLGYNSEAKEAIAFAILAYESMKGRSNNLPKATGAKKRVVLGEIAPGNNFYKYLNF